MADAWAFCDEILPYVSRSFALIIPQCPPPIDRSLCAAYLLCRIADTIEDEPRLSPACREELYDLLLHAAAEPLDTPRANAFVNSWPCIPGDYYGRLILGTTHVLAAFASLPERCRPPISGCLADMVAGMRRTAPVETRNNIRFFCRDLAQLDQYCHYVAGTVGIMSTALFEMQFEGDAFAATPAWREQGRRMGLGLQMTNILKDCRIDAQRGVSFIPARCVEWIDRQYRLSPAGREELFAHAVGHLDCAVDYVMATPAGQAGIRAFLLGSLLPAVATLEVAAPGNESEPKISRACMGEILGLIATHASDEALLRSWYDIRRAAVLRASCRAMP